MKCVELKYSDIRGKDVIDSDGDTVGEVIDWIFDCTANKLNPKYLVLGGGRVEELLESIGLKPDIDPVVSLEDVDSISDKVYLKVDGDTLKNKMDPGVLCSDDIPFTRLSEIKVVDDDNFKIGFVIDIWFDEDNMMWLVLGGGFLEEILERLGAQPDIDLLVPPHFIESIGKKEIRLNVSKFQLESTCEDEFKKYQRQLQGAKPHDDARYAQLRLGTGPGRGFV
ncbi:MAG: PRC-barrel domain-containing protein [Candidatus Thorarchaeota archaeon]